MSGVSGQAANYLCLKNPPQVISKWYLKNVEPGEQKLSLHLSCVGKCRRSVQNGHQKAQLALQVWLENNFQTKDQFQES